MLHPEALRDEADQTLSHTARKRNPRASRREAAANEGQHIATTWKAGLNVELALGRLSAIPDNPLIRKTNFSKSESRTAASNAEVRVQLTKNPSTCLLRGSKTEIGVSDGLEHRDVRTWDRRFQISTTQTFEASGIEIQSSQPLTTPESVRCRPGASFAYY